MRYEDILGTLTELIDQGKVRAIGCSNETSWGVMKSLWAADTHDVARYDTIQNNFSLFNRRCQSELAQVCRQESLSLLPYSPLGGGVLTGKYNADTPPAGARFTHYLEQGNERQKLMTARFVNERTLAATARFTEIANDIGISVTTLATAWSKQHDFVASTIIGASHIDQMEDSLKAADLILTQETLDRIDQVEEDIPLSFKEDGLRFL